MAHFDLDKTILVLFIYLLSSKSILNLGAYTIDPVHRLLFFHSSFYFSVLGTYISYFFIQTGKVGGFIASIPEVMVAALLCFMWAMLSALGLSNLRYSEAGSSRNIIIVGLSLFFSLSVPEYFQQYGISPNTNLSVPSYLHPYIVASHGPFHSKYEGVCIC